MKIYVSTYDNNPQKWIEQLYTSGIAIGHGSYNNLINHVKNWITSAEYYSDDIKFFEYEKTIYRKDNIETLDVKFIREIPLNEIKKLIMLE